MANKNRKDLESLITNRLFGSTEHVTEEDISYYREHPGQIDEVTAPLNIHKFILFIVSALGIGIVALSKFLKFSSIFSFFSAALLEFLIDVLFEIGVALLGGAIVAYILVIVLNQQQENAKKWRAEIRRRIEMKNPDNHTPNNPLNTDREDAAG